MIKLFVIIALSLLITSCNQNQNRNNEYSCMYDDGSGPDFYTITKDKIISEMFTFPIKRESNDKIYGVIFENEKNEVNATFYKRTKKLKKVFYDTQGKAVYLLECTQLN